MKKKQPWHFKGNVVMATGKPGIIIAMQENTVNNVEYVYQIDVKLIGEKFSNPYHPEDVKEAKVIAA